MNSSVKESAPLSNTLKSRTRRSTSTSTTPHRSTNRARMKPKSSPTNSGTATFSSNPAPVYWHLYGGKHTSLNSEWSEWLWRDRIFNRDQNGPPFLNLGAGSCQPWNDGPDAFLADTACRDFAKRAGTRAAITTVRDPVASEILIATGVPHRALPCPAFLAAARHRIPAANNDTIGINLMPLAAHYDVSGNFDRDRWTRACHKTCRLLRESARLLFIAHDAAEADFMRTFASPGERSFFSSAWRDYLDIYASCGAVVANRVHGAVCAAGFGVPGIIIGNDTRALIGDYIGLPVLGASDIDAESVAAQATALLQNRATHQRRLLALRDDTLQTYAQLLRDQLAHLRAAKQLTARPEPLTATR